MNTNYPREWAIKYFNDLPQKEQSLLTGKYYGSRITTSLTGSEIEKLWMQEVVLPWWEDILVWDQAKIANEIGIDSKRKVSSLTPEEIAQAYLKKH